MDRLTSMAAFVKAADLGSFAAAAAAMGLSQQMIAKHIVHLEDRVGTRLLNRTTRRQSLTEVGRSYYERCRAILAEVETADSLAREVKQVPRGALRINAPVTFGSVRLMPMVCRYLDRFPEVSIEVVLNDRFVDFIEEGFDLVFRIGTESDAGSVAHALTPFRHIVCVSSAYAQRRGTPETPAQLCEHECIVRDADCIANQIGSDGAFAEWRFRQGQQDHTVRFRSRLRVNDAKGMLSATIDGFGIGRIYEHMAGEAIASGRIAPILQGYALQPRPMSLLYQAGRRQTAKLRSFVDAALEVFGTARDEGSGI